MPIKSSIVTQWTPERVAKWNAIRQLGQRRYILKFVIGYLILSAVTIAGLYVTDRRGVVSGPWWLLLIVPATCVIGGIRHGFQSWNRNEEQMKLAIEGRNNP